MSRIIMITGGLGFIGSNLIRYWHQTYPKDLIVNVDAETYAARPSWVESYADKETWDGRWYFRETLDIRDQAAVARVLQKHMPDHLIHLAAESHVCRSIAGPKAFVDSNIVGTFNLLEEWRMLWNTDPSHRFHHVSTDEVFGELKIGQPDLFSERTAMSPRSPYAASKAASDMLCNAYFHTYGLPVTVSNCSNNFGPNQHEEKLIPKAIEKILKGEYMTVYGSGEQVRDWLWVNDHCSAIDLILHKGKPGERYCVGGDMELSNVEVINLLWEIMQEKLGDHLQLKISHTNDRPTDDMRYAIDSTKLKRLGWLATSGELEDFRVKLRKTVDWYIQNTDWSLHAH